MKREEYVERQKKRYLAQTLEQFEMTVQPLLPPDVAADFKAFVRRKMHALYLDAQDMLRLKEGEEVNGYYLEMRNRLHPEGRPMTNRS